MKRTLPRPVGHHAITPAFVVPNASKVIAFLQRAFGGKVVDRYDGPNGEVFHAEVLIGDSVVMLGEPGKGLEAQPASLSHYVSCGEQVDATYKRALAAGAISVNEPSTQPWGYRSACVRDSGGNRWTICAVVEEVTREEIEARLKDMKP